MRRDYSSLRQGLVGAWCPSLGATGYTLVDRSGRNNHGTLTNMSGQSNWQASGSGVALALDGVDDRVDLPSGNVNVVGSQFTLSSWVWYVPSSVTYPRIIEKYRQSPNPQIGWGLVIRTSDACPLLDFATVEALPSWPASLVSGIAVQQRRWTHIAATWNGQTSKIYLNGVVAASASVSGTLLQFSETTKIAIGGNPFGGYCLTGYVDDVRVYNRALTQQEILFLASRRGIGLTPLRQRRTSASSRRLHQNVSGTWKEAKPFVNVGGTWKEAAVWQNVGGTWKN
jgi:hypothetical protein